MKFELDKAFEVLERTPGVLSTLLNGLSKEWTHKNEGGESWSAYDIVGHLIHGELTDWIPRTQIILQKGENPIFEPFDRFAQNKNSKGKSLAELLVKFYDLRIQNVKMLKSLTISNQQLDWKGIHPEFGEVTLRQLLSTWVAHDLNHLAQIMRIMAKQFKEDTGPWTSYLPILTRMMQ